MQHDKLRDVLSHTVSGQHRLAHRLFPPRCIIEELEYETTSGCLRLFLKARLPVDPSCDLFSLQCIAGKTMHIMDVKVWVGASAADGVIRADSAHLRGDDWDSAWAEEHRALSRLHFANRANRRHHKEKFIYPHACLY